MSDLLLPLLGLPVVASTPLWLAIKSALDLITTATNPCEIHKTQGSEGEVDSSHHRGAIRAARDGRSLSTLNGRWKATAVLLLWSWEPHGPRGGTHHKMKRMINYYSLLNKARVRAYVRATLCPGRKKKKKKANLVTRSRGTVTKGACVILVNLPFKLKCL